jgi:lysyl-tRNA synthetase class 2
MTEERSLREIRLEKLARLRELGLDPYMTEKFSRTHSPQAAVDQFDTISGEETTLSLAGRLVSYRLMGKAGFAHLSDGDSKIQAYFRKDDLTEAEWEAYQNFDLGDHIGVTGFLFLTKTGEKTLHVKSVVPLSKSLQTLPLGKEKDGHQWYGLSDVEQRYRHRHLDLICNAEAREMLVNRSKITSATRRYFDGEGYLEVETPMLQLEAGGAAARPFKTP